MQELTDIDKTNVYSYKGDDYERSLVDFLNSKSIKAHTASIQDGYIYVVSECVVYKLPQFAQWHKIAEVIADGKYRQELK